MECFNCGMELGTQPVCPNCGANMNTYRKILLAAGAWYNDGLRRARVRDLSGAIKSLREALKYNKYHTDARNLLGLCYYEVGETVSALAEWVISKNLQPQNNRVDAYLAELQDTRGELDRMRSATRKFNMALRYCQEGSRDLAKIQLRRVISTNPRLVKAHQLLALLLIQDENYADARKSLIAANRIDAANTVTLRYMREVRNGLREQMAKRRTKKKTPDVIEMQDGNDLIMTPRLTWSDMLDYSRTSIINVAIGLIAGLLVSLFLIFPAIRTEESSRTAQALVDADSVAQSYDRNMTEMSTRVAELESELSRYVGKDDIVGSYEGVTAALQAIETEEYDRAEEILSTVNRDLLGESGQASYDNAYAVIKNVRLEASYLQGYRDNRQGNYESAKEILGAIVAEDPAYNNGNALHYLADSYDKTSDPENAIRYYRQLLEVAPGSEFAQRAQEYVQRWGETYPEVPEETPAEDAAAAGTQDEAAAGQDAAAQDAAMGDAAAGDAAATAGGDATAAGDAQQAGTEQTPAADTAQ